MNWAELWKNKKESTFERLGYRLSEIEYEGKVKAIAGIISDNTRDGDRFVNIGAGSGHLERHFTQKIREGNWSAYDANELNASESGGLVGCRTITDISWYANNYDTLVMVSSAQYFRADVILDAIRSFFKIILVDCIIEEDRLSMSTRSEGHSIVSISDVLQLKGNVKIINFCITPFRKTLIIE